jgi:hypothetical protein
MFVNRFTGFSKIDKAVVFMFLSASQDLVSKFACIEKKESSLL